MKHIMWEIDRAIRAYRDGAIIRGDIATLTGIADDRVERVLQAEGL